MRADHRAVFSLSRSAPRRRAITTLIAFCATLSVLLVLGGSTVATPGAGAQAAFDPATFDPTALAREPLFNRWGVVGRAPNIHAEQDGGGGIFNWTGPQPFVWDFAEIGDVVYVAGIFTGVRRNEFFWPNDPVRDQPFLAAFDRATGEFIPTFAPVIDAPVYDIVARPDGTLLAGGEFTVVNGQARAGLVALDASSGATVAAFPTSLAAPNAPTPAYVKELLVVGGQVYVAGSFSRVLDGAADHFVWNIVRLDVATGRLDTGWIPRTVGSVWDFAIDAARGRVQLAGYFTSVDELPNTLRVATVRLDTGRAVPGLVQYVANHSWNNDVVGITVANNATWVVGGNHLVGVLDPVTNARLKTFQDGSLPASTGDLQVVETFGRYTIAGHHQSGNGAIVVFDNVNRTLDTRWAPNLRHGWYGVWALHLDREGCLWIGGDMTRTTTGNWLSGIGRWCPPTPTLPAPAPATNHALNRAAIQSSTEAGGTAGRATDGDSNGNFAAGSVTHTALESQPYWQVDLGQARDLGSVELYRRSDCCLERNDGVWLLASPNPITARSLDAARAEAGVVSIRIGTLAGPSIVTLNRSARYLRIQAEGTTYLSLAEVRALQQRTTAVPAPTAVRATIGAGDVILRWNAPTSEAVAGYLVHRDGVYQAWVPNLTFYQDLTAGAGSSHRYDVRVRSLDGVFSAPATLTIGSVDTQAPTVPTGVAATAGAGGVALSWSPSTDDRALKGYLVHRNYQFLAFIPAGTSYLDTTAVAGVRYRYEVRAQDSSDNLSRPSTAVNVLAGAPDTQAPTIPTGVVATPSGTSVTLRWNAATDNVNVAGYLVHRDWQFVAWVPAGTTFTDTGLTAGRSYGYQIRAQDAAGNTGAPSAMTTVVVPA